ncbi:DUF58 domain-containing protein [Alkalihalobacillus sp. LMS6]|uniref:DUF58 domain-containing protein n=1 Tax=Alkalihalobacillus sp. LMS6 TaxID=2924034 RepID=UPI0020D03D90|nr:DUF58 domain-containing protein [Alkalihalobacillus sp. LMS6]UTR05662.1 DUF58 domain-containing protein [Alkalihalobacillus sp. LMS6]
MNTSTIKQASRFVLRWLIAIIIFSLSFMFAMFQGGFVSWFLFYGLVFVFLFSCMIPFLSVIGLKIDRTLRNNSIEVGEVVTVEVTLSKPAYIPFFYYQLIDRTPETFISEKSEQLFSFSFDNRFTLSYDAKGLQRGVYQFNQASVYANDLIGLIWVKRSLQVNTEVVVSPPFYKIANKHELFAYSSQAKHVRKGLNEDLISSIRHYAAGDRLSKIDWKRSAGVSGLLTKEFETEEDKGVTVVHFATSDDAFADPLQYEESIKDAASITSTLIQDRIHTTLIVYNDEWVRKELTQKNWKHALRLFAMINPVPQTKAEWAFPEKGGLCFFITPRLSKSILHMIRTTAMNRINVYLVATEALTQEQFLEVRKAGGHVFIPHQHHDRLRGEKSES